MWCFGWVARFTRREGAELTRMRHSFPARPHPPPPPPPSTHTHSEGEIAWGRQKEEEEHGSRVSGGGQQLLSSSFSQSCLSPPPSPFQLLLLECGSHPPTAPLPLCKLQEEEEEEEEKEGNAPYLRFAADAPGVLQHLQPAVAALV